MRLRPGPRLRLCQRASIIWRVSPYSTDALARGEPCVEIGVMPDGRGVIRSSQHPDGAHLVFSATQLRSFVRGIRSGAFNDLIARHETP